MQPCLITMLWGTWGCHRSPCCKWRCCCKHQQQWQKWQQNRRQRQKEPVWIQLQLLLALGKSHSRRLFSRSCWCCSSVWSVLWRPPSLTSSPSRFQPGITSLTRGIYSASFIPHLVKQQKTPPLPTGQKIRSCIRSKYSRYSRNPPQLTSKSERNEYWQHRWAYCNQPRINTGKANRHQNNH